MAAQERLAGTLARHREKILKQWQRELAGLTGRAKLSAEDTRRQADEFFDVLMSALSGGAGADTAAEAWKPMRTFLDQLSKERVMAGFSSDETATFIFSLKRAAVRGGVGESKRAARQVADDLWTITRAARQARPVHRRGVPASREEVIDRQQAGDARAVHAGGQAVGRRPGAADDRHARQRAHPGRHGERCCSGSSRPAREIAIIDITGVPTVDTLVAQHLLKTVAALRLMGADCIISGIRPQIAQTIVHLGVDLQGVTTKATLADALSPGAQAHRPRRHRGAKA